MTVEGSSIGGRTVGFESMISTVWPGSSPDLNANTAVRSSRVSSPGNLSMSALKWLDIVAPLVVIAWIGEVLRRTQNPSRGRVGPGLLRHHVGRVPGRPVLVLP